MEMTQHIAGYTLHAKLVVARRRHRYAEFDARLSPAVAAYVGEAIEANNRVYGALMDEVDRTPARIIDSFLTHFITMVWDLPGGDVKWGYLQETIERSTHIITTLKARQNLTQDALECAAIVLICALESTASWSQITVTTRDPKYHTTEHWSSWDGGLLHWLMKWQVDGRLPEYRLHRRQSLIDDLRRIREVKELLLPSLERRIGERLTEQIWDTMIGESTTNSLEALMRLGQDGSVTDMVLSRLLLMVQAGDLALNANPGQIFIDPEQSYFVHPRCLHLYLQKWMDEADDADALHDLLRRSGQASSVARMTVTPTGETGGRAIKLDAFSVSNDELRRLARMLEVGSELDRTSPWLRDALPLFCGTIEG